MHKDTFLTSKNINTKLADIFIDYLPLLNQTLTIQQAVGG